MPVRLPRAVDAWVVAALVLLALLLRLGPLQQSMFGDELYLHRIIHDRSLGGVLDEVAGTEKTPPLGFVLAWVAAALGPDDIWARVPSLLAGLATIVLVHALAARTVGRVAAAVAAAWIAISPFGIFYATESRGYAVVECLVVASTLTLLVALERGTWRWWALHGVAAAAAVYTHYIGALVVAPQLAWALVTHRERARAILLTAGGVAVAFLPWLPFFVDQFRGSSAEGAAIDAFAPTTVRTLGELAARSVAGHPFVPLRDLPGAVALVVIGAAVLVAAASWVRPRRALRDLGSRLTAGQPAVLVVLLAVVPVVGLVLYSARPQTSFLLPRNFSVAVPYATVVLAWLLVAGRRRAVTAVACAAVAGSLLVGAVQLQGTRFQKPDARDAARLIDERVAPDVAVINGQVLYVGQPPSQALFAYLRRPHRTFEAAQFAQVWADAARRRAPVALNVPDLPLAVAIFAVPKPYAARFRLVLDHATPGLAGGLRTRLWTPR